MSTKTVSLQLTDSISEHPRNDSKPMVSAEKLAVETVNGAAWDSEVENFWRSIHRSDYRFDSPYYHPDFTKAVAAIRSDVEVAILRNENRQVIAVFPFQRISENVAAPIGGRMSDFHGLIGKSIEQLDFCQLLRELNVSQFAYHALSGEHANLEPFHFETLPSYFVNLSGGFEKYKEWVRQHSSTLKRLPQKERALARMFGQVSFEMECLDQDVLETLIDLKRAKFQRTNTFDILSVEWAANLLREIAKHQNSDFRGLLSVLRAGDQIVAVHFGMITKNVLHYWFPAYDSRFSKYSPGLQLMMATCKSAAKMGIERIDMSYGASTFKDKFCNGSELVRFGLINPNSFAHSLAKKWYFTRLKLKNIPMKESLKVLLRKVLPSYGKWHFK